jgi:hypothetical protein
MHHWLVMPEEIEHVQQRRFALIRHADPPCLPAYTAEADWTAVTLASGPHLMMSGTNAHSGRGFWALASDKANIEDSADRRR